jgi:hypothetical protein
MDAFSNLTFRLLAYADKNQSSSPRLRLSEWTRDISGIAVKDAKSEAHTLAPGETKSLFDGTRTTSLNGTTEFDVSLSPLDPSRYRFAWSGGTNPVLRTSRSLALNGVAVTFTALANGSVTATIPSPAAFTGVLAGDTVLIPDASTGDAAGPFSALNGGYWQVLAVVDAQTLSLARFTGTISAVTETVTLTSNSQLQAFGSSGVQVGDKVDISAGFSAVTCKTYSVVAVTSDYFEVISTSILPPEVGIAPGVGGMIFYTNAKSVVYLEADQEACVRLNGSTDNSQRLSPIEPGNTDRPASYFKIGPTWSLSVVNRGTVTLNLIVIHFE